MAAFYGEGIDNVLVEVNESEIPIMDGSAFDFVTAIRSFGTVEQNVEKKSEIFFEMSGKYPKIVIFSLIFFQHFFFKKKIFDREKIYLFLELENFRGYFYLVKLSY